MISVGKSALGFTLLDHNEKPHTLKEFSDKNIVLYFYPKDNTPGCVTEATDFTALNDEFNKHNTVVIGISKDSCKSHQKFINDKKLSIILLSDPESKTQTDYGVWREKKFMGRTYIGTIRSTFLIDSKGIVKQRWDKVSVKGHAQEVLNAVKALNS